MSIFIKWKSKISDCFKVFVSMLMKRDDLFYLGNLDLPLNATWAQNGTTVAGKADGSSGSSISYLNGPHGLTISAANILYIADRHNNRVVMVNLNSLTVIGTFGSGSGSNPNQFNSLSDVSISQTSLYALDSYNYRIQKWSLNGTNPSTVPGAGTFGDCEYMFIDQYGYLYLSDSDNHQVIRFAPNSSVFLIIAGTGSAGSGSKQLNTPYGIYVDDNRTLYIADFYNNRIQMWKYNATSGLTVAGVNGSSGSSLNRLNGPGAVVVDTNGYMYIVDSLNNRIVRWASNSTIGVCIAACTNTAGTNANQLNNPAAVVFDNNGSLYVADQSSHRVQKFQILNKQSNTIRVSWL